MEQTIPTANYSDEAGNSNEDVDYLVIGKLSDEFPEITVAQSRLSTWCEHEGLPTRNKPTANSLRTRREEG